MYSKIIMGFLVSLVLEPVMSHPQFLNLPVFPPPVEINDIKNNRNQHRAISSPSKNNNLEETVKEVEAILRTNPSLPRLTRGEILDLLENITRADLAGTLGTQTNIFTSTDNKQLKSERDPKALMLVMPYTPETDDKNNMEDLYTKAPITHIIGPQEFGKSENEIGSGNRNQEQANKVRTRPNKPSTDKRHKYRGEPFRRVPTTTTSTTSTTTTTTTPAPTSIVEPVQHHFVERPVHRRRRPTTTTTRATSTVWTTSEPPVTTYAPVRRRPTRRRVPSTIRYSNHKYPEDQVLQTEPSKQTPSSFPSEGLRIVSPPKLEPSTFNEDLLMTDNQHKEVYLDDTVSIQKVPIEEVGVYQGDLVPQPASSYSVAVDLPENLKGVISNLNIDSPVQSPLKRKTTPKPLLNEKDVADHNEDAAKIREMLIAFGALPQKSTTTTTALPDIGTVADNLTPEMRELLMNFGLIPNPNAENPPVPVNPPYDSYNPEKPDVHPDAYVGFKPLPDDDHSRDEMEELLARFGLGRNSKHRRREVNKEDEDKLKFAAVPDEYKDVLDEIGLSDRQGKMIRAEPLTKTKEKQHVFNPQDTQSATEEEMKKLGKLLGAIKQLEQLNRTVTDEDLKEIDLGDLKELANNLNNEYNKVVPLDEQDAPNPLKYDNGLSKNEVKRQEDTTTTEAAESTTEDKGASIKDLEDSFGGQSETVVASSEAPVETTTAARQTGFYYLVDWNSFLDIDDQKGKRVNLRFQPTIGDPKRFYSVSVP